MPGLRTIEPTPLRVDRGETLHRELYGTEVLYYDARIVDRKGVYMCFRGLPESAAQLVQLAGVYPTIEAAKEPLSKIFG